jgi:hypothetical protein
VWPRRGRLSLAQSEPSLPASALRLILLAGVASAVTLGGEAWGAPRESPGPNIPRIYHKGRNFRIPFNLSAEGRDRVKEVHLLVSDDEGYHWTPVSKTYPDHPTFTFRCKQDGEYWFAVQTVTTDGKVSPRSDATVEPNLKVVVDTIPPSLVLEPEERRGTTVSVRWEVKDENLDLKSLVVEYQVEGAGVWRRAPIRKPKLIGAQAWDSGTVEALKVRASVADKAGNVTEQVADIPEAAAPPPGLVSSDPGQISRSSVERISNGAGGDITAGADFPPVDEDLPARREPPPGAGAAQGVASPEMPLRDRRPSWPGWARDGGASAGRLRGSAAAPPQGDQMDLFAGSNGAGPGSPSPNPSGGFGASRDLGPPPDPPPVSVRGGNGGTLLVPSPKFNLQYAVEDAGPNGPASVELWITQDGGRTWIRRGEDPDRVSPLEVDLGGEGTYGLCLVAKSAAGLGDQPPAPGEPPQTWVEVDSTPPLVQLYPPQAGSGVNSGKVAISWRASDLHLAPKSVSIFWRPEQPGTNWQLVADGQENVGQFVWNVPASVPPRFHLRVEAVDSLGHRGGADTTEVGAVMVDRSRPRSRIIGLDPNARTGFGPSARPLR